MTSTFTSNLTLEKPGAGEQANSWGNTLNSNLDAIDAAIGLRFTGDPNNNVAADFIGQVCVDSSNKIIYIATTAGNAATAVWTPANVADATVALTGAVVGTANFVSGNASISTSFATDPMPTGMILMFGGTSAPSGYLLCNGASVSRSTYSALFAVIGTAYGSASSSTFNIPGFDGNVPRGAGSAGSLGATGGSETVTPSGSVAAITPTGSVSVSGNTASHTLTVNEMPSHDHYLFANHSMEQNANADWVRRYGNAYKSGGIEKSASLEGYQASGSDDFKYSIGFDRNNATPSVHPSSNTGGAQGHSHSLSASASFSGNAITPSFSGSSTSVLNPHVFVNYIIKT
jgi:microcystin-dependent protein